MMVLGMLDNKPKTKQDKEWQAYEDAQSLARADVIKDDGPRLKAARAAAVEIAKRDKEVADAMARVARTRKNPEKKGDGEGEKKKRKPTKPKSQHNVFGRV